MLSRDVLQRLQDALLHALQTAHVEVSVGIPEQLRDVGGGLVKTQAFVVLKPGIAPLDALVDELKAFVKERLAPHKYPRDIPFVDDLPKTATGKIQRFKLRELL